MSRTSSNEYTGVSRDISRLQQQLNDEDITATTSLTETRQSQLESLDGKMDINDDEEEEQDAEKLQSFGDKPPSEAHSIFNLNKDNNSSPQIVEELKSPLLPEMQQMDDGDKGIEAALFSTKTEPEKELDLNIPEIFPVQKTPSGNFKILKNRVEFSDDKITITVENPRQIHNNIIEREEESLRSLKEDNVARKSDSGNDQRPNSRNQLHQPSLPTNIDHHNPTSGGLDLNECLQYRLRRAIHPDMKVVIGTKEFPCHSIALQAYSKYFDSMKRPAETIHKIHMSEEIIKAEDFSCFMDWILLENEELKTRVIRKNNVVALYSASMHLGIPGLKDHCLRFVNEKLNKSGETVILELYDHCRKLPNCKDLQKKLASKFSNLFPTLYKTKHFLNMNVDELVLLISSDDVKIQSELDIYDVASSWLLQDWKNRHQYTVRIMGCVRFGLLTPLQLTQIRQFDYNRIYSYQEIKDALQDGLTFAVLQENYKNRPDELRKWIELSKIHEPRPRTCICSDQNNSLESSKKVSSVNKTFRIQSEVKTRKWNSQYPEQIYRNEDRQITNRNLIKNSEIVTRASNAHFNDSNVLQNSNTDNNNSKTVGKQQKNDLSLNPNQKLQNPKKRNSNLSNPFTMESVLNLKNGRVQEKVSWRM